MPLAEDADRLTSYVRDRIGEYFLGTVTYDADSHDLRAVADEVSPAYGPETVAALVDLLRDHHEVGRTDQYPDIPAGDLQTSIYVLEDAIVLHYMVTRSGGIAVAMDPEAGRNLFRFVTESRRYIQAAT